MKEGDVEIVGEKGMVLDGLIHVLQFAKQVEIEIR